MSLSKPCPKCGQEIEFNSQDTEYLGYNVAEKSHKYHFYCDECGNEFLHSSYAPEFETEAFD